MPTCSACAEDVDPAATKCPHCGEPLGARAASGARPAGLSYDVLQDKVGLVPNVRVKDNVIQAGVTLAAITLGAGVGFALGGGEGALGGVLAGLLVGGLGSGFVLMIIGLKRK